MFSESFKETNIMCTFLFSGLNSRVTQREGTVTKFTHPIGNDTTMFEGDLIPVAVKYHSISIMKEYFNKSFEELRLEDYCLISMSIGYRGYVFDISGT